MDSLNNNLDSFDSFNDIKSFDDNDILDKNTQIYFMDSNNNYVDMSIASKCVVRILDDEGNLIEETWYDLNKKNNDNTKLDILFVDENGNKVSKDEACKVIFRKIDGINIVSENTYLISDYKSIVKK